MPPTLRAPEQWSHLQGQGPAWLFALALGLGTIAGGSMALWGIGGACVLYGLTVAAQRRLPCPPPAILGWGGSFLLLVFAALLLQPFDAARSWPMAWRLTSFVLPLMLLFAVPAGRPWPDWSRRLLPGLFLAALTLILADILLQGQFLLALLQGKHGQLTYYNRGLSYAAVLLWPLLALLRPRPAWLAAGLGVALFLVAWLSTSRGAPLALVVGAAFYLGAQRWPRLTRLAGWGLLALVAFFVLALTPWLVGTHQPWLHHLPPSWHHRFEIWDTVLAYYGMRPLLAAGVDATGILPALARGYVYATAPAAHPHHMFLQLLFELGPLGWLWGTALAGCVWHKIVQQPERRGRAAAAACWAAMLTLSCGAFSLWTDSFWATGALAWLFCRKAKEG